VPPVGARIRATGTIGRAYDAPRLRATAIAVLAVGARPLPLALTSQPTAAHEWRLVAVTGAIADVHKLGQRWRAELSVGSDTVVVNGLAGSGIAARSIVEGRRATIVGIVRRPYPGASDRRWSIVPRGPGDVAVGGTSEGGSAGGSSGGRGAGTGTASGTREAGVPDVDLVALAQHVGRTVRVGGLVEALETDGFTLDDGTASGRVVLVAEAAEYLSLIEPGDALNATGRVEREGDELRVVVADAAGLVRVGDPTGAEATALAGEPAEGISDPAPGSARLAGGLLGFEPGAAGLVSLVLLSAASLAVTVARRRRAQRLLAARIGARLARIAGPGAARPAGPPAG
jgi:hypothetical protein